MSEHDPAVLAERIAALDRLVQISVQNAEKALTKANDAMEKRFDCVAADTLVLCADLLWRPAGTLMVGDELIALDDEIPSRHGRRFRRSIVTANSIEEDALLEVVTPRGSVRCNENHPWLTRPAKNAQHHVVWRWTQAKDLGIGDTVHHPLDVWERDTSWEAEWLAGMFDGEGCLSVRKDGGVSQLSVTQRESETSDRVARALERVLGHEAPSFVFQPGTRSAPLNTMPIVHFIISKRPDVMRLLGVVRPPRLLVNSDAVWDGATIGGRGRRTTILEINQAGRGEIAMLSTSTGTFIANGFAMHNSVNEFRSALSDQQAMFLTRDTFNTFSELSATDRARLHTLYGELRVSQKDFVTITSMDTEISALQNQIMLLQGSVSRMLITLLSSLVLTVVGALLWDLAHR